MDPRPGSIHTLNSGNLQELGTGGYESPIENRRSYPPPVGLASVQERPGYAQQQQQVPTQQQPQYQQDNNRQRTHSFSSAASGYENPALDYGGGGGQGVQAPYTTGETYAQQGQGGYQAYPPQAGMAQQQHQQRSVSGSSAGGEDPGGFYR